MKAKVTNNWILNFNALRGYLNMVSKETNKPIYSLGRDATYAISRTGKKVKDELELLAEKEKELTEKEAALKDKPEELATFRKASKEEWDALLDKEVEVEVHGFYITDLPADIAMPEGFFETLDPLIIEKGTPV